MNWMNAITDFGFNAFETFSIIDWEVGFKAIKKRCANQHWISFTVLNVYVK